MIVYNQSHTKMSSIHCHITEVVPRPPVDVRMFLTFHVLLVMGREFVFLCYSNPDMVTFNLHQIFGKYNVSGFG